MQLAALHVACGMWQGDGKGFLGRNGNSWQRRNIKSFYLRLPASCQLPHATSSLGYCAEENPSSAKPKNVTQIWTKAIYVHQLSYDNASHANSRLASRMCIRQ